MKKLLTFLLLPALLCSLLTGCVVIKILQKETSIERVERLTGYDLPNDMEELYYFQDKTFTGCAGQYSVYTLAEEPFCIIDSKKEENYDTEEDLSAEKIAQIIDYLDINNVPSEYYPDFEQSYSYISGAENTYIFYFPEEQTLKISMLGH